MREPSALTETREKLTEDLLKVEDSRDELEAEVLETLDPRWCLASLFSTPSHKVR